MPLEAAPMLGRGFEHQTKGFILSNANQPISKVTTPYAAMYDTENFGFDASRRCNP